jgi:CxxH/CxxC protein (TIGR04129 family)
MKIYSCNEHIDEALDEAVDMQELAPNMEKIEDVNNLSTSCFRCGNPAEYIVGTDEV